MKPHALTTPAKSIGIIGGGQLGFMLGLEAYRLGVVPRFLDPNPSSPAFLIGEGTVASFEDCNAILDFARKVDVVTYEFENISATILEAIESEIPLYPSSMPLLVSQDRLLEKRFFAQFGAHTAPFSPVANTDDLKRALAEMSAPCILKTRTLGYDGKGQIRIDPASAIPEDALELVSRPCVLEKRIDFDRELSLVACRAGSGDIRFYPLVENIHRRGILHRTIAPAPETSTYLIDSAQNLAREVLEECDYQGTLTIEFFVKGEELLVNEFAPRVHNSGHWSMNGANTSQFENHIRAVVGLPLGDTTARGTTIMLNLIGTIPETALILSFPWAHIHLYHKAERPGRKVGHVNITASSLSEALVREQEILARFPGLFPSLLEEDIIK